MSNINLAGTCTPSSTATGNMTRPSSGNVSYSPVTGQGWRWTFVSGTANGKVYLNKLVGGHYVSPTGPYNFDEMKSLWLEAAKLFP